MGMPGEDISKPAVARRIYAAILALVSLPLLAGGAYLVSLGGSPYYVAAGAVTLASGIWLWRGRVEGALGYATLLFATLAWALWEAGFDGWALMPRLVAPAVLGIPLLFPAIRRGLATPHDRLARLARPGALGIAALAALIAGIGLTQLRTPDPFDPIYQTGPFGGAIPTATAGGPAEGDWLHYGGDPGGTRYSRLDQIRPANVAGLKPAWTFRVGDTYGLEVTPIKVADTLYLCTAYNDVIALDAETGRQRWRFNAHIVKENVPYHVCRGVAYYRAPGLSGDCAERIITNTTDARLIALDARSGRLCQGFGRNGQVSLLTGLSKSPVGYYAVTSAPTMAGGKVVLGGWVSDGQYWGEPAGVVRAFDAITGELAWAWDVGRPDRQTLPPPGETYTHSTPNAWAPFSADERLGLVYVPTGNPAVDYFGGRRRPFDEKFGSSVVAIEAATGKTRWVFQTAHHDVWDWDVASQPTLVDIAYPSGVRHALVQPTKRGEVFVLDRATGKPLSPVVEKAVPQAGAVPEERLSPTQPFSVGMPSYRGPDFTERFMWGITPLDQLWCRIRFKESRYEGTATPPGLQPNIAYPGFNGGIDWGSVSVDPERQLLFVNSNRVANYDRLLTRAEADARVKQFVAREVGGPVRQGGTPYAAHIQIFRTPLGIPCNQPPYGMISAVDLRSGKLVWAQRFGNGRAAGPWGIRSMLPILVGTPNNGGSLATRSGLLFIGATHDGDFRAFDTSSGRMLWHVRLPAGGQATPMTYISPKSGRQFVVIAAGGHPALRSVLGDYIIGYALPK
ncbi:membrane-bound PQQ-dependent dehydrogenase, glucose/quinate/shikimate family [Sphingomonas sp. Root710]|uniref:membrane-bound PQQ-dependent dehydrogenase, glucose/quinate/shikimate family n=1 Tax=Sphingomonas sp. Root710 TaxID=1736594 RepID=UPI000A868EE8|nr:membrane-bound PQQ-dependent dehydrogenase, glucose/quinate/shikimate family [Sphingomonas sp. Root710]